jgi:hypothetical protein
LTIIASNVVARVELVSMNNGFLIDANNLEELIEVLNSLEFEKK